MDVEFKKSFEKDLSKLWDKPLLTRIRAVILETEAAENLESVREARWRSLSYFEVFTGLLHN